MTVDYSVNMSLCVARYVSFIFRNVEDYFFWSWSWSFFILVLFSWPIIGEFLFSSDAILAFFKSVLVLLIATLSAVWWLQRNKCSRQWTTITSSSSSNTSNNMEVLAGVTEAMVFGNKWKLTIHTNTHTYTHGTRRKCSISICYLYVCGFFYQNFDMNSLYVCVFSYTPSFQKNKIPCVKEFLDFQKYR